MSKLVAKCGIDCGACPWGPYPRKGMSAQDFEAYKRDAKRVLGHVPIKTPCVTCQIPDDKIPKTSKLPNKRCLIRQCVDKAGVENCGYCSRFPCDTVTETAGAWNRESIEVKLGASLSEEAYHSFVEPFEGLARLEAIRDSLKPDKIVDPAKVCVPKIRLADFPKNLPFSKDEVSSFKAVYNLLANIERSSFGLKDTDTFAQQHKLKKQRAHVLRFLWLLGAYGEFENGDTSRLVVDAETYLFNRGSEKSLAIWSFVDGVIFKLLSGFGVCCERLVLDGLLKEELTTGTGYLRKKGWVMSMSFDAKIGGKNALEALQVYIKKLAKEYGKRAFQRFCVADMHVLSAA
ncbi:MAG: DUF3795 domain-containing protein [Candidatus Bathyarchaeota archaeon]|nr:DUF3795 domain-containing protein [Candidatus Bathyarchaeum sp.]